MSAAVSFNEYLGSLSRLSVDSDPTIETAHAVEIKEAHEELAALPDITGESLAAWATGNPKMAHVLGLVVGLGQERLKNISRQLFDTSSVAQQARRDPEKLIAALDEQYDLIRLLKKQLGKSYTLGDVLVARAGGRAKAKSAAVSGRSVEDEIEQVAKDLGLSYETRTRFNGKNGKDAPCDLVIPNKENALIAVAAKGFDSTGSKLTDAVREIQEMAEIRLPRQFICAVVDGIGWASRKADLQRLWVMWDTDQIDGLYTMSDLSRFRDDIEQQAKILHLL